MVYLTECAVDIKHSALLLTYNTSSPKRERERDTSASIAFVSFPRLYNSVDLPGLNFVCSLAESSPLVSFGICSESRAHTPNHTYSHSLSYYSSLARLLMWHISVFLSRWPHPRQVASITPLVGVIRCTSFSHLNPIKSTLFYQHNSLVTIVLQTNLCQALIWIVLVMCHNCHSNLQFNNSN